MAENTRKCAMDAMKEQIDHLKKQTDDQIEAIKKLNDRLDDRDCEMNERFDNRDREFAALLNVRDWESATSMADIKVVMMQVIAEGLHSSKKPLSESSRQSVRLGENEGSSSRQAEFTKIRNQLSEPLLYKRPQITEEGSSSSPAAQTGPDLGESNTIGPAPIVDSVLREPDLVGGTEVLGSCTTISKLSVDDSSEMVCDNKPKEERNLTLKNKSGRSSDYNLEEFSSVISSPIRSQDLEAESFNSKDCMVESIPGVEPEATWETEAEISITSSKGKHSLHFLINWNSIDMEVNMNSSLSKCDGIAEIKSMSCDDCDSMICSDCNVFVVSDWRVEIAEGIVCYDPGICMVCYSSSANVYYLLETEYGVTSSCVDGKGAENKSGSTEKDDIRMGVWRYNESFISNILFVAVNNFDGFRKSELSNGGIKSTEFCKSSQEFRVVVTRNMTSKPMIRKNLRPCALVEVHRDEHFSANIFHSSSSYEDGVGYAKLENLNELKDEIEQSFMCYDPGIDVMFHGNLARIDLVEDPSIESGDGNAGYSEQVIISKFIDKWWYLSLEIISSLRASLKTREREVYELNVSAWVIIGSWEIMENVCELCTCKLLVHGVVHSFPRESRGFWFCISDGVQGMILLNFVVKMQENDISSGDQGKGSRCDFKRVGFPECIICVILSSNGDQSNTCSNIKYDENDNSKGEVNKVISGSFVKLNCWGDSYQNGESKVEFVLLLQFSLTQQWIVTWLIAWECTHESLFQGNDLLLWENNILLRLLITEAWMGLLILQLEERDFGADESTKSETVATLVGKADASTTDDNEDDVLGSLVLQEGSHEGRSDDATLSALDEDDFQTLTIENKLGCEIFIKRVQETSDRIELLRHNSCASVWFPSPRYSDRLNVADESREPRRYIAVKIVEAKGLPVADDENNHNFFCALRLVGESQELNQQKLFSQSTRTKCVKPLIERSDDVVEGTATWNELFHF